MKEASIYNSPEAQLIELISADIITLSGDGIPEDTDDVSTPLA